MRIMSFFLLSAALISIILYLIGDAYAAVVIALVDLSIVIGCWAFYCLVPSPVEREISFHLSKTELKTINEKAFEISRESTPRNLIVIACGIALIALSNLGNGEMSWLRISRGQCRGVILLFTILTLIGVNIPFIIRYSKWIKCYLYNTDYAKRNGYTSEENNTEQL